MKPLGYEAVQHATASGRDTERELLQRVTTRLKAARPDDPAGLAMLHEALRLNRNVWMTFAADLASPQNPLPNDLKASMISIASFVERNTLAAAKSREVLDCFIDINTSVMNGLATESAAAQSEEH